MAKPKRSRSDEPVQQSNTAKTFRVLDKDLTADELFTEHQETEKYVKRLQADFANFKRRTEAENVRIASVSKMAVVLDLLPVIDNFDRAFKNVPDEVAGTSWYEGIAAIKQQFEGFLENLGITRIKSVGEVFDPNLHEAVSTEPDEVHPKDTISEEFEAGYRLGDDIIRHARVKVSSGPQTKKGD
jgi:molecular chaperone GrpE